MSNTIAPSKDRSYLLYQEVVLKNAAAYPTYPIDPLLHNALHIFRNFWIFLLCIYGGLEPLNNGHSHFVLYREAVLYSEVKMYKYNREGASKLSFRARFFFIVYFIQNVLYQKFYCIYLFYTQPYHIVVTYWMYAAGCRVIEDVKCSTEMP